MILEKTNKLKKIIINADDYGMSPLFNKGIEELILKNIVTSITVMIDREYISAKSLKRFNNVSVGLHLILEKSSSKKQIEKQISKFHEVFGRLPSHLDGHQHCHIDETNIENTVLVASKYDLPVRSVQQNDRIFFKTHDITTPDAYLSWHPSRQEILLEKLRLSEGPVVELVCHPGYYDPSRPYPYNARREDELQFLKSRAFQKTILYFEKISYNDL